MVNTYRAGLVGCGRIGTLWETEPPTPVTHAGALAVCPQTDLVAGSSRGAEHLHAFGKRWGVDALVERGLIGDLVALYGFCQGVKPFPAWTADEEGHF